MYTTAHTPQHYHCQPSMHSSRIGPKYAPLLSPMVQGPNAHCKHGVSVLNTASTHTATVLHTPGHDMLLKMMCL